MDQQHRRYAVIISIIITVALVLVLYFTVFNGEPGTFESKDIKIWRLTDSLDYKTSLQPHPTFAQAWATSTLCGPPVDNKSYDDARMVFFESFNSIDSIINQVKWPKNSNHCTVYGMAGSDCMASKGLLAHYMRQAGLVHYLPPTFILCMHNDVAALVQYAKAHPDAVYIMKKNIQRQEGCFVTAKLSQVIKLRHEYVVAQAILQDPLVVGGRKINLRVYLLVVVRGSGQCEMYRYSDGFVYYTPKPFVAHTADSEHIITTGYIDRSVYAENPLTYNDLSEHLGEGSARVLDDSIGTMCAEIKRAFEGVLLQHNRDMPRDQTRACIFGMDVAPDTKLGCKVMEINKGPDLSFKDDRDRAVKLQMVADMLGMLGLSCGTLTPENEEHLRGSGRQATPRSSLRKIDWLNCGTHANCT